MTQPDTPDGPLGPEEQPPISCPRPDGQEIAELRRDLDSDVTTLLRREAFSPDGIASRICRLSRAYRTLEQHTNWQTKRADALLATHATRQAAHDALAAEIAALRAERDAERERAEKAEQQRDSLMRFIVRKHPPDGSGKDCWYIYTTLTEVVDDPSEVLSQIRQFAGIPADHAAAGLTPAGEEQAE